MERPTPEQPGQSAVEQPLWRKWWFVLILALAIVGLLFVRSLMA